MQPILISGLAMGGCALILFVLGLLQWRAKEPVGFYTGEKRIPAAEIRDVTAWNHRHGLMWMLYGGFILLGYIVGIFTPGMWTLIPMLCPILLPLPLMIALHHKMLRRYRIPKEETNES